MQELDKVAMGKRIRQIRTAAGLRQWELAKLLGTTQSAVHKYEHGVVPEPRRLVELARVGGTSLEWVLTGRHWENGSDDQARIDAELLETASAFRRVSEPGRRTIDDAIRIMRDSLDAVESISPEERRDPTATIAALRSHGRDTLELLHAASRIQRAVLRRLTSDAAAKLDPALVEEADAGLAGGDGEGEAKPARTRRARSGR